AESWARPAASAGAADGSGPVTDAADGSDRVTGGVAGSDPGVRGEGRGCGQAAGGLAASVSAGSYCPGDRGGHCGPAGRASDTREVSQPRSFADTPRRDLL